MLLAACGAAPAGLEFGDAYVRAPVPGTDKSVGYFSLTNHTGQALTLTAAAAPGVRAIEFHYTEEVDGLMRMRRLPRIEVEAGGRIEFVPGGRHLMLFGVQDLGEELEVTFQDAGGGSHAVHFAVTDVTQTR